MLSLRTLVEELHVEEVIRVTMYECGHKQTRKVNMISIDSICIERSKYYDVKVNEMHFYNSNIRYDISYIRVWINYKNSLKPV